VEHNEAYKSRISKYMLRHKVKPGITGWAQVNGFRGQTDTPEKMALRIQHDLWYIQKGSFWLDLKILLMTPFVMMHRNAY
jgi:putative colanic acid biosynthesis UDP-glucose lipid carrier transferase